MLDILKKIVFLRHEKRGSLGRVARHRSAKPFTPVRIWKRPQEVPSLGGTFFIVSRRINKIIYLFKIKTVRKLFFQIVVVQI